MATKSNTELLMGALQEHFDTGVRVGRTRGIEQTIAVVAGEIRGMAPPIHPSQVLSPETPIETLNLDRRTYNLLKREGLHTIGKLCEMTTEDLLDIRNFGEGCLRVTEKALKAVGWALKDFHEPGQMPLPDMPENSTGQAPPRDSEQQDQPDKEALQQFQAGYELAKNEVLAALEQIETTYLR